MLARGYLNDPERTNAAFIEDPVWLRRIDPAQPRRLYKTGDLVKFNEDGSLIFVGRKDSQIKFRGQRIELGEIEHVMRAMTIIDKALVIVQGNGCDKDGGSVFTPEYSTSEGRDGRPERIIPGGHERSPTPDCRDSQSSLSIISVIHLFTGPPSHHDVSFDNFRKD